MTSHAQSMDSRAFEVLQDARRLRARANRGPRDLKHRLQGPGVVLAAGLLLAVGAAAALLLDLPGSAESRRLAAYVFLGGVAVSAAAIGGFGVILWSAYVQQYVDALEARTEAAEALHQMIGIADELKDAELRREIELRVLAASEDAEPKHNQQLCRRVVETTTEIASIRIEQYLKRLEENTGTT